MLPLDPLAARVLEWCGTLTGARTLGQLAAALAQPPADVFPSGRAFFPGDNPLAGIDGALIS